MTTRQTAAGTECIRCTHSPKENNMHPGTVPMELEVGEMWSIKRIMCSILVAISPPI